MIGGDTTIEGRDDIDTAEKVLALGAKLTAEPKRMWTLTENLSRVKDEEASICADRKYVAQASLNENARHLVITIDKLLGRLEGVIQVDHTRWRAHCPSHESTMPSLSIRVSDSGKILLNDFSGGCDIVEICAAIGLRVRDLIPDSRPYLRPDQRGTNYTGARVTDFLDLIDYETRVIATVVGRMLSSGCAPSDEEWLLLSHAIATINRLRDTIRPAKRPKEK